MKCIRFSSAESLAHIRKKTDYVISYCLEHDFLTEVRSADNKFRADLVIFTIPMPTIVEFAVSESEESLRAKESYWSNKGFKFMVR